MHPVRDRVKSRAAAKQPRRTSPRAARFPRAPEFALRTDSAETRRFDSVGNARAEEAIKNKKKWSNDAAAGKPIRANVSANANSDKLTVMSIN